MKAQYAQIDLHNDEEYKKLFDYVCTKRALDPIEMRSKLKTSGKVTIDALNKLCADQELTIKIDYKAKTLMIVYYPAKVVEPVSEEQDTEDPVEGPQKEELVDIPPVTTENPKEDEDEGPKEEEVKKSPILEDDDDDDEDDPF